MTFKAEGSFKVTITEATLAESKFDKNNPEVVDVALLLKTEDGQQDWWTGELSKKYGVGTMAGKMQWEITLESLKKIGWKHDTDISEETLKSLVGVETEVYVKGREYEGKTYYDPKYIGPSSFGPKALKGPDSKARLASIFGSGPAPSEAKAETEEAEEVDPFA